MLILRFVFEKKIKNNRECSLIVKKKETTSSKIETDLERNGLELNR
jgi:hypothetical protein